MKIHKIMVYISAAIFSFMSMQLLAAQNGSMQQNAGKHSAHKTKECDCKNCTCKPCKCKGSAKKMKQH